MVSLLLEFYQEPVVLCGITIYLVYIQHNISFFSFFKYKLDLNTQLQKVSAMFEQEVGIGHVKFRVLRYSGSQCGILITIVDPQALDISHLRIIWYYFTYASCRDNTEMRPISRRRKLLQKQAYSSMITLITVNFLPAKRVDTNDENFTEFSYSRLSKWLRSISSSPPLLPYTQLTGPSQPFEERKNAIM